MAIEQNRIEAAARALCSDGVRKRFPHGVSWDSASLLVAEVLAAAFP